MSLITKAPNHPLRREMAFVDLPVEVLNNVCLHLRNGCINSYRGQCQPTANKSLMSLVRTSKRLYRIALPHLYYHVDVGSQGFRLVPFTRLLLDNPHLADLVHKINLSDCDEFERDQVLEDHFSTQPPASLPEESLREDHSIRVKGLDDSYAAQVLDLFLAKARNLEYIDLMILYDDYFDTDCFTYIRDKHVADPDFLCKLKEVVLRHWDTENGFHFESIIPLLSGTQIQSLTMWSCTGVAEIESFSFPSLLELKIFDSGLSQVNSARIFDWCPNLERFEYTVGAASVTEGCDLASPEEISLALFPLRKSLRTLLLYLPFEDVMSGDPISSLVQFSILQSLTIDVNALAGEMDGTWDEWWSTAAEWRAFRRRPCLSGWLDKLPRCLQNLCIMQSTEALRSELSKLAERAKLDFPDLKILTLDKPFGLAPLFRETGIEYREIEASSILED